MPVPAMQCSTRRPLQGLERSLLRSVGAMDGFPIPTKQGASYDPHDRHDQRSKSVVCYSRRRSIERTVIDSRRRSRHLEIRSAREGRAEEERYHGCSNQGRRQLTERHGRWSNGNNQRRTQHAGRQIARSCCQIKAPATRRGFFSFSKFFMSSELATRMGVLVAWPTI
jgi:hypothetical protein